MSRDAFRAWSACALDLLLWVAVVIVLSTLVRGGAGTWDIPHTGVASAVDLASAHAASCNGSKNFSNTAGLWVNVSLCEPSLHSSFSAPGNSLSLPFGFSHLAEVNAADQVVSLANLHAASFGVLSTTTGPSGTTITAPWSATVTDGSGLWAPSDTSLGMGTQPITPGNTTLGVSAFTLTVHLYHGGNNDTRVQFDLNITGWPWVSSADQLGVEVDSFASPGTAFSYAPTSSTLTEAGSTTGSTQASLVFGGSANTSTKGEGPLPVATQAGLFASGAADDSAALLLTFAGGPGGYASLQYDPWLIYTLNSGPGGPGSSPAPPLPEAAWLAIVGIIALATAMGAFGIYLRREPMEEGLAGPFEAGGSTPRPSMVAMGRPATGPAHRGWRPPGRPIGPRRTPRGSRRAEG